MTNATTTRTENTTRTTTTTSSTYTTTGAAWNAATENTTPAARDDFDIIRAEIEKSPARSAWTRGVKLYALDLVNDLEDAVKGGWIFADDLQSSAMLEKAMLNGADNWQAYSAGGCALIYNGDIARRLCAPYELKITHDGEREPNARETWVDVQARALYQAARLVHETVENLVDLFAED